MTLANVLTEIQRIVGGVEGIRAAPEFVPDKAPPGIYSVVIPATGDMGQGPVQVLEGLHNVELYIFCPRIDLPKTLKTIIPLLEPVCIALENNEKLNDTCSTFGKITYVFNPLINLGTASEPGWYSGWVLTINSIKIQDSSSLT